jgi:hypothetical protein
MSSFESCRPHQLRQGNSEIHTALRDTSCAAWRYETNVKGKKATRRARKGQGAAAASAVGPTADSQGTAEEMHTSYTRQQHGRHVRTRTRIRTAGYLTGLELAVRALAQLLHNSVTSLHKYE